MSVVAFDGKLLAVDRLGDAAGMKIPMPKSELQPPFALAWIGGLAEGMAMASWFKLGPRRSLEFPAFQADRDRWCRLIVACKTECFFYEQTQMPIPVLTKFMAWGSGRDYAMGAMAMGADAKKAVEVANEWDIACGFGVDVYDLTKL